MWFFWPRRRGAFGRSGQDRKSTRLNSSHQIISYAVFCLKKKKAIRNHEKRSTPPPSAERTQLRGIARVFQSGPLRKDRKITIQSDHSALRSRCLLYQLLQ